MKIVDLNAKIKVFQKLANMDMPIKTAWKVQQNIALLEKDYSIAENLKNEIIRKYGEDDGKGNIVVTDPDKKRIVVDELAKLEDTDLEKDIEFKKIKLEELGDIKLTPADIYAMSDIIEVPDDFNT